MSNKQQVNTVLWVQTIHSLHSVGQHPLSSICTDNIQSSVSKHSQSSMAIENIQPIALTKPSEYT